MAQPEGAKAPPREEKKKGKAPEAKDIGRVTVLDVLRVLGGVVLLNFALSWYVTGESLFWGFRPWFARMDGVKAWMRGPVLLTDEQLTAYDGSDPSKPIYLALNGTIYDVSAGSHFYGPGGGYSFFAGRDAARAYVTGCFDTDLTPDLRGVEEMYLPLDEPEDPSPTTTPDPTEPTLTPAELKNRRAQERRDARKKVAATIDGWARVFAGETGKEYVAVGSVVREEGWLEKLPRRELCQKAQDIRPKRAKGGKRRGEKARKKKEAAAAAAAGKK